MLVHEVRITCDHRADDGRPCSETTGVLAAAEGDRPDARQARAAAAGAGWVRRFGPSSCGYDLCPTHARQVPAETFPDWRGRPMHVGDRALPRPVPPALQPGPGDAARRALVRLPDGRVGVVTFVPKYGSQAKVLVGGRHEKHPPELLRLVEPDLAV